MRVLVTGGTGYLGQAIVRALLARGHAPVVFARTGMPSDWNAAHVSHIVGDVRDRDALVDAARGCEAMIHTAALVAVWRRRAADFDDVNIGGLRHAVEAVQAHGLRRLVYTSSFLALPPAGQTSIPAGNDYQRTKALAERVAAQAHASGVPLVRMYPGVIYGPGAMSDGNQVGRQLADHVGGRLPGLIGADRLWSFSWVDSVANAHVAALEHPRPEPGYQVGGPNAPQQRPFEILRALRGTRLPTRLPLWAGHVAAMVDPARSGLLGVPRQITHETVTIFRHDWPLDSSAAQRDLGYTFPALDDGIQTVVEQL